MRVTNIERRARARTLVQEALTVIREGELEEARELLLDAYGREPSEDLARFARQMAVFEKMMHRDAAVLRALADM